MIKLEKITKIHRTDTVETTALNDIDLIIEKGEFVSITGPSGCGKSTLLNILGLLDDCDGGQYLFNDQSLSQLKEKQRASFRKREIGVIFQSFNLIDELSVRQNVELPLLYQNVPNRDRKMRVDEVLERVGIGHRTNHYPQQLSGGQQQRVAIARAIVGKPNLILADEPTGNLDTKNGDEVMSLLAELHEAGSTIVMVTHSEHHAALGSRSIAILDGSIVANKH